MTKSFFGGMPSFTSSGGAGGFLAKIKNNMSFGTIGIILIILIFVVVSVYYYYKVIYHNLKTNYFLYSWHFKK